MKILNGKREPLPSGLQKLAYQEHVEWTTVKNAIGVSKVDHSLFNSFKWDDTKDGGNFWNQIDRGIYTLYYEKYSINNWWW